MATKKDLLTERTQLERKINSGKISGKAKIQKARKKMASLKFRATHLNVSVRKTKAGKPTFPKKAKAKSLTADPAQGILPGFSEMVAPKAAELARELVFEALRKAIGEELEKVVTKLKVV